MRYIIIAFLIFANSNLLAQDVAGQEQFNFSIGAGMTDWYNLAVKYQLSQAQLGISYGTSFFQDRKDKLMVLSISGYKHIFGQSKLSERKPWFVRIGISYLRKEYDKEIRHQDVYGSFYFGRDVNISRRVGISVSGGPAFRFYSKDQYEGSSKRQFVLPGIDVNLFYRFLHRY